MASAGLTYALNNGSTEEQYYKQIFDAFVKAQSQGLSDAQIEIGMSQYGISAADLAQATGVTPESVQTRMDVATPTTAADLAYERAAQEELATRQAQEDARLASLIAPVETAPVITPPVVQPVGLLETPVTSPVVAPVTAPVTAPVGLLQTPVTAPVAAPVTAPVGLLESPVVTPPVTTGSNMATSAALNYALNNGMTQEQFDKRIFDAVLAAQQPGSTTTNAMLRSEMDRLGISTEDVARATGVSTQSVQEKYNVALPKTNAELIADAAADAELAARTARDTTASAATIAAARQAATTSQGLLGAADQTAATAAAATLAAQQKAAADAQAVINAKAAADAKAAAALKTKTTATTQTGLNAQLEKAYKDGDIALLNSLLAQNQVTSAQAKNMFNLTDADLSWIQNNAGGKFYTPATPTTPTPATAAPGANMGISGSFANFQSIPIGAQYNPAVTAGGASPYSQIMGQMKPFTNPYQNVVTNTPMGGYDPGLYDKIEAANVAKTIATQEADRLAATQTGMEQSSTGGLAGGGMVHGGLMFGMNPPGPDDGAVNLDLGEYVVKKSAVNKYGRGLLDMINEGKVPAKKMKSLLG